MYLGRQVVRRSARTLRPVAGSRVRASTSTPWQIAPTGLPSAPEPADLLLSTGEPRYCRMPGACPPGSSRPSKAAGSSPAHATVALNSGAADELVVQRLGLGRGAELAEDHAGQQPGIGGRDRARPLGGEHHLMTRVAQDPPRHRDLGDVEVPVGKRQQHAHPAIIPFATVRRNERTGGEMSGDADREFTTLAQEYLDDRAERHPTAATDLGDHRFDARLGDPSEQARADERRALDGWAARLEAIDDGALSAEHRVDAAMMAGSVARRVFELDELREHTWNPLQANPGKAIYQLLARDFAPLPERLAAVAGRLAEVPAVLAEARRLGRSGPCPGCTWRPPSGSSRARSRWSAGRSTMR